MAEQIIIENKKTAQLSSVKEVKSYTDKDIKLVLLDGVTLCVSGESLKINSFSKQSGALLFEGEILSLRFKKKGDNFLKKVLK